MIINYLEIILADFKYLFWMLYNNRYICIRNQNGNNFKRGGQHGKHGKAS